MNATAGLDKKNLNTQGEIFKSLKSFEIIVPGLHSHKFQPGRKFTTLRIWALIIRRKITWMKWVKRGCQKQYWKDKVSEGKEHTTADPLCHRLQICLRKKGSKKRHYLRIAFKPISLTHSTTEGQEHHNYGLFQVTNRWLYSI